MHLLGGITRYPGEGRVGRDDMAAVIRDHDSLTAVGEDRIGKLELGVVALDDGGPPSHAKHQHL